MQFLQKKILIYNKKLKKIAKSIKGETNWNVPHRGTEGEEQRRTKRRTPEMYSGSTVSITTDHRSHFGKNC